MPRRPLTLFFLAVCAGVPLAQAALELARGERVQALEVFGSIEVQRLRRFEDDLREASFLHRHVTPHYNRGLFAALGRGNEKAVPMGDGRLQYGEDLDALTRERHWARSRNGGPAPRGRGSPWHPVALRGEADPREHAA